MPEKTVVELLRKKLLKQALSCCGEPNICNLTRHSSLLAFTKCLRPDAPRGQVADSSADPYLTLNPQLITSDSVESHAADDGGVEDLSSALILVLFT